MIWAIGPYHLLLTNKMFSELVHQLFPDYCEVVQLNDSKFVFPIMKNGSTSFELDIQFFDLNIISNENIANITHPITVFVRNPKDRFISGVNTYLQQTKRDNPTLDEATILWFVKKYLFLNLHYCPQFFWLINLSRYMSPDTKLEFRSMSDFGNYTKTFDISADVDKPSPSLLKELKEFNWEKLELYFYLDQQLEELIGSTVTWNEVIKKIRSVPLLDELVFKKTLEITKLCGARD